MLMPTQRGEAKDDIDAAASLADQAEEPGCRELTNRQPLQNFRSRGSASNFVPKSDPSDGGFNRVKHREDRGVIHLHTHGAVSRASHAATR